MRRTLMIGAVLVLSSLGASAQQPAAKPAAKAAAAPAAGKSDAAKIREALSAAPADIAAGAGVMDWGTTPNGPMKELKKGTNGWTCMPSTPQEAGSPTSSDPMCLDKSFMGWADAYMAKKDPQVKTTGIAYMLKGDAPGTSNTDPFATGPTADNHWVVSPAHIMVVVSDPASLDTLSTDPGRGGPWVMWKGTKYAHIMVPITSMPKRVTAAKAAPAAAPKK